MAITGTRLNHAEAAKRCREARAWRIAMKPHFDSIYGPEEPLTAPVATFPYPHCSMAVVMAAEAQADKARLGEAA